MTQLILEVLIGILPLLIITICIKLRKQKINNLIDLVFFGILSAILALIIATPIGDTSLFQILKENKGLPLFIYWLIVAGLIEEVTKYIALKSTKPKSKKEIFINMLYVSTIFTIYEDLGYIFTANFPLKLAVFRALTPMHLVFNLIMIFFLQKAFDHRKNNNKGKALGLEILAIMIPALLHGFYDFILAQFNITINNQNPIMLVATTIICYASVIIAIFKFLKPENTEEIEANTEIKPEIKKIFLSKIFKPFKLLFIAISILLIFSIRPSIYEMHEKIKLEQTNLELTVNSVKEETDIFNSHNTIINVTLKNSNNEDFNLFDLNCNLSDKKNERIKTFYNTAKDNILKGNTTITTDLHFNTAYKKDYQLICGVSKLNKQKLKFETIDEVKINIKKEEK